MFRVEGIGIEDWRLKPLRLGEEEIILYQSYKFFGGAINKSGHCFWMKMV